MRTESTAPESAFRTLAGAGGILVLLDGNVVQRLPLTGRVLTIGRLPENELVLPHQSVSRYHAELRLEATGPVLTDVGSSAGTFVGELRLAPHQPFALEAGAIAAIGPYTIEYLPPSVPRGELRPPEPIAVSFLADAPVAPLADVVPARAATPLALTPSALDEHLAEVPARATYPAMVPPAGESTYLRDLPAVFQDNEFLGRMLQIFEAIWEPLERRQDHLPLYFSPRTCPGPFLPWLASWLHLTLNPHWPEERRRHLLSEAMDLYRWRGTPYGLTRMIEVSTGLTPAISEEAGRPFVFRIVVRAPPGSDVRRETVEELVRLHKPAHVGYVLEMTP